MKKLLLFIAVALFMIQSAVAQLNAKVDEKFELTTILFALAGAPEYQSGMPSYRDDIDTYFKPYELTEPIEYIKQIRENYAIGYDAVSTTTDMLEIKNGKIELQPQYDISKISEYDSRWNGEIFAKYIDMLNVFYKKSNFNKFFQDHKPLYDLAEQVVNDQIGSISVGWFKSFYGEDLDSSLKVYISLSNDSNNYSMNGGVLLGIKSRYGHFYADYRTTFALIRELSRHYANDIFVSYWDQVEGAANKILHKVNNGMTNDYGGDAETVMTEWFVRLCGLMYDKETNSENIRENLFLRNSSQGFIWMESSFEFMDNFYANRDKYPTIEEFMPQLVGFLNFIAVNFEFVETQNNRRPYITNVYPALGSDISNDTEMVITFSEPMSGPCGHSYNSEDGYLDLMTQKEQSDPNLHTWSDDGLKYTYKLPVNRLKPGLKYGIKLRDFVSERGKLMAKGEIEFIYTTAEK